MFSFSIIGDGVDRILLEFSCKHGIKKTHRLHFQQVETLTAIYNKQECFNKFSISPKIVSEWIGYFQSSLEEVSMNCNQSNIVIKSFSDETVDKRCLETELNVMSGDFDSYLVVEATNFVIRLKEFKVILQFGESLGRTVSAFFRGPGRYTCFNLVQLYFQLPSQIFSKLIL